ncbi:MAG: DUF4174 domain-containing protein [Paracoccaceae bacterium]
MSVNLALAALLSIGPYAAEDRAADLADLRWENRPVLIFAESRDDAELREQLDRLGRAQAALVERRMAILIDTGEDTALRRRFEPDGFTVILIGLDGSEKLRRGRVVEAGELTGLVDTMPMRRREMRE